MKTLLCILFLAYVPGIAYASTSLPWTEDDTVSAEIINKAERYLNSIKTLQSDFTQVAPDGAIASGEFYLQRPGKMRWQYNPPVPVLMVSRGSFLRYYDYELEQVSDIPIEDSLAGFLVRETIDFHDEDIKILNANVQHGIATIKLTQRADPDDGELTFEFETAPYLLRNIILKDAKGEETNISLSDAAFNVTLDPELFELEDFRRKRRQRR